MTKERWQELMKNDEIPLTPQEIVEGWHFCAGWDALLIQPGMKEAEFCLCGIKPNKTNENHLQ